MSKKMLWLDITMCTQIMIVPQYFVMYSDVVRIVVIIIYYKLLIVIKKLF